MEGLIMYPESRDSVRGGDPEIAPGNPPEVPQPNQKIHTNTKLKHKSEDLLCLN